jgi:two-component sensor histidine kinase
VNTEAKSRHDPALRGWRPYHHHPLDLIAVFRRWPPSALRSYVYTTLVCFAVVFVIVLINASFNHWPTVGEIKRYAVITVCIGVCQQFVFDVLGWISTRVRLGHAATASTIIAVAAPLIGLYGGFFLSAMMLGGDRWFDLLFNRSTLLINTFIVGVVALFIWYSSANQARIQQAELAEARSAAEAEAAKRETMNAELKALRAQIEPHFLYNTLANVVSLIDSEPTQAKHMAVRLIGYLRHTLDASRRDHATLADELTSIADYLEILRLRMGERLTYSIDADASVRALPLMPMLLQPLVENAIKHGLEPKISGGHISIRASSSAESLRIEIGDNGLGFALTPKLHADDGSGVGLANVRARLRAKYGGEASLVIDTLPVGETGAIRSGTCVTIIIPIRS